MFYEYAKVIDVLRKSTPLVFQLLLPSPHVIAVLQAEKGGSHVA